MQLRQLYVFATLCTMGFASCTRDELPVKPHESGNVTIAGVDMDATYKWQIYFDLKTNTVVGKSDKAIWDIGLETTADGYHVVLNGAKAMFAMATSKTDFADVKMTDTAGFATNSKWDAAGGSMDSTAIGDWRKNKAVYILDRGYDAALKHQGWAKLQLLSVSDTSYQLRFAALDGTNEAVLAVRKDSAYNLAFVSFATKNTVMVEPVKYNWDLVFSQYTYVFYNLTPPTPYLVTGCLLNRYHTTCYLDTTSQFTNITYSNVAEEKLADDISGIGYDWKVYTNGTYVIRPENNYVIQDAAGVLYKLHFTAFYSTTGAKGSPQWEYQQL